MTFEIVEIFVLVFVVLALIKLLFILFSPKAWMNLTKAIYKNSAILVIVELILAAIVFYYLSMEISLIYIMAGILIGALLTGMVFAIYSKEIVPIFTKTFKSNLIKRAWLPLIIWLALVIWTLTEIF